MITRFHTALLRLYPRQFQSDFGIEMEEVFRQATCEGKAQAMRFFFREVRDFPANLLRQYWSAIRKEEIPITTFIQTEEPQPGTWREAVWAGLPHLLMGLLFGVGKLFDQTIQINQIISIVLGGILGVTVITTLVFAWQCGWPLWSASWYFYGSWVILMALGLLIEKLNLEESWRYGNALFLGWIVTCIIGYFVILAKSNLHGLLSVAPIFPMLSLTIMEFIPNPVEGGLAISVGLLAALTAGAVVRRGEFATALKLVLGFNLATGLIWAYTNEYKMLDLPPLAPAHVPQFDRFLMNLMFYSIFGLGLVALPFILRGLWNFGKCKFT